MFAYPFAIAANRLGLCSYKWVNVGHGAWRSDRFNELWHWQWYGTPIEDLPDEVILGGIMYRAAAAEGAVTFFDNVTKCRITFYRDDLAHEVMGREALWYLELSSYHQHAAAHVREAYAWVCAVFGDSHEWKRPTSGRTPFVARAQGAKA